MSKARACFNRLISGLGYSVGLLIGLAALMITVEVVMRNTGFGGISWLNEVVEYALYAGTFAAAPWALNKGAHVRVDILVVSLPRRTGIAVEKATDMLGATICSVLTYFGGIAVLDAYVEGNVQYKTLAMPEWPLLLVVPVCTFLLAVEFLFRFQRVTEDTLSTAQKDGF